MNSLADKIRMKAEVLHALDHNPAPEDRQQLLVRAAWLEEHIFHEMLATRPGDAAVNGFSAAALWLRAGDKARAEKLAAEAAAEVRREK